MAPLLHKIYKKYLIYFITSVIFILPSSRACTAEHKTIFIFLQSISTPCSAKIFLYTCIIFSPAFNHANKIIFLCLKPYEMIFCDQFTKYIYLLNYLNILKYFLFSRQLSIRITEYMLSLDLYFYFDSFAIPLKNL